jgi:hypothetical protein
MKHFLTATVGALTAAERSGLRSLPESRKTSSELGGAVSSEIATSISERAERRRRRVTRRQLRVLTVQLLGPLTTIAGVVWAMAQPYRIVFLDPDGKGIYDFLFQPPLLVVVVGLAYAVGVAPGLVEDLEAEDDDPAT